MKFDKELLDGLLVKAACSERLRTNYDLRTSAEDGVAEDGECSGAGDFWSRPKVVVAVHRHPMSNENVILLTGKLVEVLFDVL